MLAFSDSKAYRSETLREDLKALTVQRVWASKAIITIETRNGWWNWQGDTGYLWHAVSAFDLTLESARAKVEKNRKQGSFFEIKECPILLLDINDLDSLIINMYEIYKYVGEANRFSVSHNVGEIVRELRCGLPMHILHAFCVNKSMFTPLKDSECYASYKSSRGASRALDWNISRDVADMKPLLTSIVKFNSRVA